MSISVLVKPETVNWDEIQHVIYESHAINRKKGIIMKNPLLSGYAISQKMGKNGIMLLAMDQENIVGTAGLIPTTKSTWYNEGCYGYCCFDAVLPTYLGQGIFKKLNIKREQIAREMGLSKLYIDTHEKNTRVIKICLRNGYKRVSVKDCNDHWNIVLFKWMDGCPYSQFACHIHYIKEIIINKLYKIKMLVLKSIGRKQ